MFASNFNLVFNFGKYIPFLLAQSVSFNRKCYFHNLKWLMYDKNIKEMLKLKYFSIIILILNVPFVHFLIMK